jgi:Holliday junction resolvasome RuvABC endonuclease subunit
MKILALDLSTKTGFAVYKDLELIGYGQMKLEKPILAYGPYPWCYAMAADAVAKSVWDLVVTHQPQIIVIEETNLGKNRYAQKALEFIHCSVLRALSLRASSDFQIVYLSSSSWRKALELTLTKEDKKNNTKLSKAKAFAEASKTKLDKKTLGIRGRINKKHVALRFVNQHFNLSLKVKDNDTADAICLGLAYSRGAVVCDGI